MQEQLLEYKDTGYFSELITDYISQKDALRHFYKYPLSYDAFPRAIEEKQMQPVNRQLLVEVLRDQYENISAGEEVSQNISLLLKDNTFTITTAHQNNIFTGPLYYHIKIISAINMCRKLREQYPDFNFVPVFWMGSEDHDFEEINHVHLFGKKVEWKAQSEGPVGRMKASRLKKAIEEIENIMGEGEHAQRLSKLFRSAYLEHKTIAEATQYLLHELYKSDGLVVLDADDKRLKKEFLTVITDEMFNRHSERIVNNRIDELKQGYKVQAIARDINLFYMKDGFRERIVYNKGNDDYEVLNTHLFFTEEAMRQELKECPENFSPNVILRPLYQEYILPGLAYIGGGGEIAYWLELEPLFEHYKVNFPMLIVRNSILWIDGNSGRKMESLGMDTDDLFKDEDRLIAKFVQEQTEEELTLEEEKHAIKDIFTRISTKATDIDPTMEKPVAGEEQKVINSIEKLEAKLLKAEKRKFDTSINQIRAVKDKLFPNSNLQERHENFISFYLRYGDDFFHSLKDAIMPIDKQFIILREE